MQGNQLAAYGIKVNRKISLKQFDLATDLSAEVKQSHLSTATHGLDTIFSSLSADYPLSLEMLYRSVELLCKYQHGRYLYDQVNKAVEGYCVRELKPLIHNLQHQSQNLTENVLAAWEVLREKHAVVEATFAYLFEVWAPGSLAGLGPLCAGHFRQHALGNKAHELVRLVSAKIGPGYVKEDGHMQRMLAMLHQLSLMPQIMQNMQDAVDKFPILEGDLVQGLGVFEDFDGSFKKMLPTSEYQQEYSCLLRKHYLGKYVGLFGKWVPLAIEEGLQNEFVAMAKISKACDKVDSFTTVLKGALREYFRKTLIKVDMDAPERAVALMIKVMEKFSDWLMPFSSFLSSKDLVTEAADAALNINSELSAELLAVYCNWLLQSGGMGGDANYADKTLYFMENEQPGDEGHYDMDADDPLQAPRVTKPLIIREVDRVIRILRLVHAKEHFELVYRRFYSRRALDLVRRGNPVAKGQVENYVLERLEQEMGLSYVSKLQAIWREVQAGGEDEYGLDMEEGCLVPEGIWAFTAPSACVEVKKGVAALDRASLLTDLFRKDGKVLKMLDGLCTFGINVTLHKGPVYIDVSLPHAAILAQYKDQEINTTISSEQLFKNSGIKSQELFNKALRTLSSNKFPLLVKSDGGYRINFTFDVPHGKVTQLSLYSRKELMLLDCPMLAQATSSNVFTSANTSAESIETPPVDPTMKGHQLEAAIVRLLKKHKTIKREELRAKVQEALLWRVEDEEWKRHVESLQEREFIGTGKSDTDTLQYIP